MEEISFLQRLARRVVEHPVLRDAIVNTKPTFRRAAVALGHYYGNLPMFYSGDTLISEHLSIDHRYLDATGDIAGWYDRCLAMLDRAIGNYPTIGSFIGKIKSTSVRYPLHFAPVEPNGRYYLTTTYHDGEIEIPFFAYVRKHMDAFMAIDPPPCTMYFLLQLRLPGREEYLSRVS